MKNIDRSGIRTRATEVTGALNQRLRPLGHPAIGYLQIIYEAKLNIQEKALCAII